MRVLVFLSLLLISACAKPQVIGLDARAIAAMKVEAVVVEYAPNAHVWWGEMESDYAKSKGLERPFTAVRPGDEEPSEEDLAKEKAYLDAVESPEAKAFVQNRVTALVERAVGGGAAIHMQGDRPVNVKATVSNLHIASVGQRLLLGGNHQIVTTVELKDAVTGETLAQPIPLGVIITGGNGLAGVLVSQAFSTPEKRLEEGLRDRTSQWLSSGTAP